MEFYLYIELFTQDEGIFPFTAKVMVRLTLPQYSRRFMVFPRSLCSKYEQAQPRTSSRWLFGKGLDN